MSVAAIGRYVASPPTLADGNEQALLIGTTGKLQIDVSTIAAGDNNIGNVDIASNAALIAGTAYIGQVASPLQYVTLTPVCDTSAYTAEDVLFDRIVVTNATRLADTPAILDSVQLLDEDDQTAARIDLYFLDADVTLGTANAAISISDANARSILGVVSLAAASFNDLIASKMCTIKNVGLMVSPATGTRNIFVAGVCGGTPTQTASGIRLRLGFRSV
jgi:hypothetical protein